MKRKNYTKTIFYSMALSIIFVMLSVIPAFAYEGSESETTDINISASDNSTIDTANIDKTIEENEKTFLDSLYLALSENLSEILSVFTFAGSLILMIGYKKGFLPLLSDGLKALAGGVKSIGDKTETLSLDAEKLTENIQEKITLAEEVLLKMSTTLTALEEKLKTSEEINDERSKLKTVLTAEIDLLYEIFMAASLPQYLKDNVGERIALMKNELKENRTDECKD